MSPSLTTSAEAGDRGNSLSLTSVSRDSGRDPLLNIGGGDSGDSLSYKDHEEDGENCIEPE